LDRALIDLVLMTGALTISLWAGCGVATHSYSFHEKVPAIPLPREEILQQSAEVAFIEVTSLPLDSIGSVSQGVSSVELLAFSDQG
jgi:hypothetical protein